MRQGPEGGAVAEIPDPVREKRLRFPREGTDGRVLEGNFFYRRPSPRDLLRIEAEKARLIFRPRGWKSIPQTSGVLLSMSHHPDRSPRRQATTGGLC
jgi:hypothetical protein